MKDKYTNTLGSERTIETVFMLECLNNMCDENTKVLDVGGVPSNASQMREAYELIKSKKLNYKVADFRGGDYTGDFVKYDFGDKKFDLVIFLSSLEHFPQCTEGDKKYREGEDRKGFEKALSILNDGGKILLTVPFGKHRWQNYHQNYDWKGILNLTKGLEIIEYYTYQLFNAKDNQFSGEWILTDPTLMEDLLYTDRAFGCGCFVLGNEL